MSLRQSGGVSMSVDLTRNYSQDMYVLIHEALAYKYEDHEDTMPSR